MIRRPPRSTRTDTLFPTRRSSDLPSIVRGAVDAITDYGSLHWSCARTRLSFALHRDLEAEISQLFRARVVAFSSVMLANLGALPLIASGHLTGGVKPVVAFDRICPASLAYHKPEIGRAQA